MKKATICGVMLAGMTGLSAFAEDPATGAASDGAGSQKQSIAEGEKKLSLPADSNMPKTASTNKQPSIIGKRVFDTNGIELGKVQDLVVDMEKGELGYVVLEVQTEDGPRKLPVPARALKTGEPEGTLVLNISQAVLAAAEVYRDDELPEPNAFSVDTAAVGSAAGSETGASASEKKNSDARQLQTEQGEQPKK